MYLSLVSVTCLSRIVSAEYVVGVERFFHILPLLVTN